MHNDRLEDNSLNNKLRYWYYYLFRSRHKVVDYDRFLDTGCVYLRSRISPEQAASIICNTPRDDPARGADIGRLAIDLKSRDHSTGVALPNVPLSGIRLS